MKEILSTRSLSQAYALRTALEAAGIDAVVNGEHSLGTIAGGLSVVVLQDGDLEPARRILAGLAEAESPGA